MDNIPIEEAAYMLNIRNSTFCDVLERVTNRSFVLLFLARLNGTRPVEQIRQNQSYDDDYNTVKFKVGNYGNVLSQTDEEKEHLNSIRRRKTSKS